MKQLVILIAILGFCYTSDIQAQDRVFTFTYQSGTLKKGQREIEVWNTLESGRTNFYRGLNSRVEFELGLSHNLQTSFYLNLNNSTEEVLTNLENAEIRYLEHNTQIGFSNEWKLNLSNPSANLMGSALYAELELFPSEIAIETKLILDKQLDHTLHALNLTFEPEWETEESSEGAEQEFEMKFGLSYGFSYTLNPRLNAGIEIVNSNVYQEEEKFEYSALYAGPTLSYTAENFWINFSLLPQLNSIYKKENNSSEKRIFEGEEKLKARLIFSLNL